MTTLAMPARNVRAIRAALSSLLAAVAVATGHAMRLVGRAFAFAPGIAAACVVSWGAAQIYTPAGWIAGGLFLLAADRQIKLRPGGGDG